MIVIGHRGYGLKYPENSYSAFLNAFKNGLSVELDVHLSKDGIPFIIHEEFIDSLLSGKGKVRDIRSNELRSLVYKADKSLKLLRLEDVLHLFKGINPKNCMLFIHIKDIQEQGVIRTCAELIAKTGLEQKCFVFAVDGMELPLISEMRRVNFSIRVGLYLPQNSANFKEEIFRLADFVWADEIDTNWLSKEMVEMAHKLKKEVYAISPEVIPSSKKAKEYKKRWGDLITMGFDGICTDYPDELNKFKELKK